MSLPQKSVKYSWCHSDNDSIMKTPIEIEDRAVLAVELFRVSPETMDPTYVIPVHSFDGRDRWIVNEYDNGKLFKVKVIRNGPHLFAE